MRLTNGKLSYFVYGIGIWLIISSSLALWWMYIDRTWSISKQTTMSHVEDGIKTLIQHVAAGEESTFDEQVSRLTDQYERVFVLAFAQVSKDTGKSWCKDCRVAWPHIMSAIKQFSMHKRDVLLVLDVPRKPYRGNPNYIYRVHPRLRLQGVPQLYKWTKDRNAHIPTLIEDDCWNDQKLRNFIEYQPQIKNHHVE